MIGYLWRAVFWSFAHWHSQVNTWMTKHILASMRANVVPCEAFCILFEATTIPASCAPSPFWFIEMGGKFTASWNHEVIYWASWPSAYFTIDPLFAGHLDLTLLFRLIREHRKLLHAFQILESLQLTLKGFDIGFLVANKLWLYKCAPYFSWFKECWCLLQKFGNWYFWRIVDSVR